VRDPPEDLPRHLRLGGADPDGRHRQGKVNAVHPFREGNGRTQRAFFEQLAREAGYPLAWQRLDAARNIDASAAIMRGDAEPMRKLLGTLVADGI
jgi:cell filamentation protein